MTKPKIAYTLIAGFLLFGVADAKADLTAGQLARGCAEFLSQTEGSALCVGYISGVIDAYRNINRLAPPSGQMFCIPEGASATTIVQTVKNDLLMHPEKLSMQAASVVLGAISSAFPCK